MYKKVIILTGIFSALCFGTAQAENMKAMPSFDNNLSSGSFSSTDVPSMKLPEGMTFDSTFDSMQKSFKDSEALEQPDISTMSSEEIAKKFGVDMGTSLGKVESNELDTSSFDSLKKTKDEILKEMQSSSDSVHQGLLGNNYFSDTSNDEKLTMKTNDDLDQEWEDMKKEFQNDGFGSLSTELKTPVTKEYSSDLKKNLQDGFKGYDIPTGAEDLSIPNSYNGSEAIEKLQKNKDSLLAGANQELKNSSSFKDIQSHIAKAQAGNKK